MCLKGLLYLQLTSSLAFIVSILNFASGAGGRENFNILASDDVDGDNSNGEDDEEDDAQERTSEDEALSAEGSDGESNLKSRQWRISKR